MREILFRGKFVENGEWLFGSLVLDKSLKDKGKEMPFIREKGLSEATTYFYGGAGLNVKPETVGQFTGLIDKKGTKIFEGDIVKFTDYDSYDYECFETAGVVMYGGNMFYITNRHSVGMEDLVDDLENTMECEVIGNIYDNPELLGVTE